MLSKKEIKKIQWLIIKDLIKMEEDVKKIDKNNKYNEKMLELLYNDIKENQDILQTLNIMEDEVQEY